MASREIEEYGLHPSSDLNRLFAAVEFPHQGQDPQAASIVFIGLDANYSSAISSVGAFFPYILEYHTDEVAFWSKYGVHHPFLLEEYPLKKNTGGVPYHKNFAKMRLDSSFAQKISFIELVPHPTTGRTVETTFWSIFDIAHAKRIDALLKEGGKKLIILSSSVMRKMEKAAKLYDVFQWLPETFRLGEMKKIKQSIIFGAPHFSSSVSNEALQSLGETIRGFCKDAP